MGKINVGYMTKSWFKTWKKKKKYGNQWNVLHKYTSNRWFRNGIHSLL